MKLQNQMLQELKLKKIFNQAKDCAFEYIDGVEEMDVYPSSNTLKKLNQFNEKLAHESTPANEIIEQLHQFGSPNTIAQTGGRYFGFVNGGALPVSLGVKWLSDVWDQCGGLYLTSPINAHLEVICENWLKELFKLPKQTVAGFVSGTSIANFCGMAAARYQLLKNLGWNVNENGLNSAPKLRILAHEQVHASVKKTLALLGYGINSIEWLPSDTQGRLMVDKLPKIDNTCLILMQAGNVNTGAYDDFDSVCDLANKAGAWVHIDGAFGLWATVSKSLSYLTKGIEKADSWAVDGHKTLNTPYDSGIILCKNPDALASAMQATGDYIVYSENRDPLLYTPELSKRSRAIELWACMKYLGKSGMDEMISRFHQHAQYMAQGLKSLGFDILNDVVFNQVLVAYKSDEQTAQITEFIQKSGECWLSGSKWQGKTVIRISICSWVTTRSDIDKTINLFEKALNVSHN